MESHTIIYKAQIASRPVFQRGITPLPFIVSELIINMIKKYMIVVGIPIVALVLFVVACLALRRHRAQRHDLGDQELESVVPSESEYTNTSITAPPAPPAAKTAKTATSGLSEMPSQHTPANTGGSSLQRNSITLDGTSSPVEESRRDSDIFGKYVEWPNVVDILPSDPTPLLERNLTWLKTKLRAMKRGGNL